MVEIPASESKSHDDEWKEKTAIRNSYKKRFRYKADYFFPTEEHPEICAITC